jgi:hypothetical protein
MGGLQPWDKHVIGAAVGLTIHVNRSTIRKEHQNDGILRAKCWPIVACCRVMQRDGYAKLDKDAELGLVVSCQNKQKSSTPQSKAKGSEGAGGSGAAARGSGATVSNEHNQQFAMEFDFATWENMKRIVRPGKALIQRQ